MADDTDDRVSRSQLQALGAAFGVTDLVDPEGLDHAPLPEHDQGAVDLVAGQAGGVRQDLG